MINFLMRAASTLEITNDEQRAVRSILKRCFAPSYLADTFRTGQQVQSQALNMIRRYRGQDGRGSTLPSSLQPIMPCLICRLLQNYFT